MKFLSRFSYYATGLTDLDKVRKALFMFTDLFGMERYNYQHLVTFILTVKTNYRSVVYHNWAHGFHVANSIYSILKEAGTQYTIINKDKTKSLVPTATQEVSDREEIRSAIESLTCVCQRSDCFLLIAGDFS